MIESLVIALREGIEAALVVGIILAYLRKTGRDSLSRFVYIGLVLAAIASLGVAAMFQILDIDPENEFMEGTLLGVAGVFVASMVLWMWRTARNIKQQLEDRLASLVVSDAASMGQGVGLLVFTFLMVFREGVEMVLFLAAATLGEMNVLSFIGGIFGLGLAALFAVFFVRGSVRINLSRFFTVTSIVLLLLAIKLVAGSVHEFAEVQVIPMNKEIMAFLGYFVRDDSSTIILMALLAVPAVLLIWGMQGKPGASESTLEGLPSAERRKRLAAAGRERAWRLAGVAAALVTIFAMGTTVLAGSNFVDPVPQPVAASGEEVRIPVASLEEGRLHKFVAQIADVGVRLLAVKLEDGSLVTAVDACSICGAVGYAQEGENAICKNCNAPIPMRTMGLGGGCNPFPLKSTTDGTALMIALKDLETAQPRFSK
ncbi:MAG: DUF2318 domain-containing protein [Chloroflexi bacterium]|nr:DUF2318 domain-containing protein [Chloroflexota bacterium]